MSDTENRNPLGAGLSAIGKIKEKIKPAIGKMDFLSGGATVELSGLISLKSCWGKYLSAQADGRLEWNRDWDREWEQFKAEPLSGGRTAFKSCHGLYLSVKGDGTVMCDQRTAGENEIWTVEPASGGIGLKSRFGKYLRPGPDGRVTASGNAVTEKETFTVTDHGQGGK
jgi:hypothetical protein